MRLLRSSGLVTSVTLVCSLLLAGLGECSRSTPRGESGIQAREDKDVSRKLRTGKPGDTITAWGNTLNLAIGGQWKAQKSGKPTMALSRVLLDANPKIGGDPLDQPEWILKEMVRQSGGQKLDKVLLFVPNLSIGTHSSDDSTVPDLLEEIAKEMFKAAKDRSGAIHAMKHTEQYIWNAHVRDRWAGLVDDTGNPILGQAINVKSDTQLIKFMTNRMAYINSESDPAYTHPEFWDKAAEQTENDPEGDA